MVVNVIYRPVAKKNFSSPSRRKPVAAPSTEASRGGYLLPGSAQVGNLLANPESQAILCDKEIHGFLLFGIFQVDDEEGLAVFPRATMASPSSLPAHSIVGKKPRSVIAFQISSARFS
ncbi:hypothetical protein EJ997_00025 [Flaviflexus ciconiae]|uniref:Uncharacterized protein n=1 Tax=Flaviflexus ciconiae TaxID=2496867 RepID=A0A3Q9G038_9ACTO|nr:hypothetical protein [Flaviflexus ciconiae]AZQ75945.1 hypothetical protein EJ997_00025 [Flaviflexus ciconiae]